MSSQKEVVKLINDLANDPNLVVDDTTYEYLEQQYPTTFHHSMKNFNKVHTTWKNVREALRWNESQVTNLDPISKADMASNKARFSKMLLLNPTLGNKWSELQFRNWTHRVNVIVIDAYHACWKDTGASTDYARYLFKPSETLNLATTVHDTRNIQGLKRFNEVLINSPYSMPENIDELLNKITEEELPVVTANLTADDAWTRSDAATQLAAIKASMKASLKSAHQANTTTFLVMLLDLIPGARNRNSKSQLFTRISDHRETHLNTQRGLIENQRTAYTANHVLNFIKEKYVQNNRNARHVAWDNILLPVRPNKMSLIDWLKMFDKLVSAYTAAGILDSQKVLSADEQRTVQVQIGRQVNDKEIIALASIHPAYSGSAIIDGTFDLIKLKTDVIENPTRLPIFKHDIRTTENVVKDYDAREKPLPSFLLPKDDQKKRKHPSPHQPRKPRPRSVYSTEQGKKGKMKGPKGKHPY